MSKWYKGSEMTFDDAVSRYFASCERRGIASARQPSESSSDQSDGWWLLNNVNGLIASVNELTGYVKLPR
jgi:hypothetical protein